MLNIYKKFFYYFGQGYKHYIPLVILGAAIAGVFEIAGLLLLLPFVRLLMRPEAIQKHRFLHSIMMKLNIGSPLSQAIAVGGLVVAIFVFKNIYLLFYHFWQSRVLRSWKIDINTELMRFYLFSPYKLHLLKTSDRIIRNVNNVVLKSLNGFILQGFLVISNLIAGIAVLLILMQRTFIFTLITAVVLLFFSVLQHYFLKHKVRKLGEERNELSSEFYNNVFQGLHAIKETKVLGREQYFLDNFYGVNQATMDNDMWTMFYKQFPSRATEICAILCVVIMCIGVIHSNLGDDPAMVASLGILAAVAMRTSSIVNRILASLQQIHNAQNSVKILFDEIQSPLWLEYQQAEEEKQSGVETKTLVFHSDITFQDVSFTYPKSKRPALSHVNTQIQKGEFIGVVGPSGAGKTTFVDVLLGLLQPEEGVVFVDGVLLDHKTLPSWQEHIGYVPQQVYISNDSVVRNVAFGIKDNEIDIGLVENALRKARIYDHVMTMSDGLQTPLGENGRKLSGGQKQRIGIARALYHHADVLILDEATSSLDVPTEGKITEAINSLKGQQTIIAIAHRLSTLKSCDRILYFDKRKLVDTGTFESLSEKYEKFAQMIKLSKI